MEKTQKILKKFISLILTFAISFGSYVFPVFAALPDDNEAPTIGDVVESYKTFELKRGSVAEKIDELKATSPSPDSAIGKAVGEVESFLVEFDKNYTNKIDNVDTPKTLKVVTTAYNVITVIVNFNDLSDDTDLGITLTNETMQKQVLKDTYTLLQQDYYKLDFIAKYLDKAEISDSYFNAVDEVSNDFDKVSSYIEKLDQLKITTYDRDLYETYALELAKLMIVEVTEEDITTVNNLSNEIKEYANVITTMLQENLLQKFEDLNALATTNNTIAGIGLVETNTADAIDQLKNTSTYDLLVLSDQYISDFDDYNNAMLENEKNTNPEKYIETKIEEINEMLRETFNLNITVEQIASIESLVTPGNPTNVEDLVADMDANELSEKLISGELSYEILDAYIKYVNGPANIKQQVETLKASLNSSEDVEKVDKAIEEDIFGLNGNYMEELDSIKNESNTDEERLQILNKLELMDKYLNKIKAEILPSTANVETAITPITDKITELKEKFGKSCDNTLTNLTINGIEMDVKEESYKVYVGNDVTELTIIFEKSNQNAKVEILNGKDLKVGTNEVIVLVTAENGEVRQYIIEVIRAEAPVVTVENDNTDKAVATQLNNVISEETVEEEHKNTSDSAERYDQEIEEKEGLSAFTVLLIVAGIALVGYGVYKIFGDKEDQKIEKAFEQPKVNKNKTIPSKNPTNKINNNKKKNNKKRK